MLRFGYFNLILLFSIQLSFGGEGKLIKLPDFKKDSNFSIEKAIYQRRSTRSFSSKSLRLSDISALLWAGQGITSRDRLRTAPSAGALYPIELYLVAFNVEALSPGIYKYLPFEHSLKLIKPQDIKNELCSAALGQECVKEASAVIV
ncbi:MAG: SagB/ThcOx family dehydrogenase, partial [Brevinematia bacterium]